MKIVVTGSLGHISKPLTEELIQKGHSVTVVSHNPERQKEIESLGASAAIGSMDDVKFLTKTFSGADAVYCMISAGNAYSDPAFDLMAYTLRLGNNYKQAILETGVKRVVFLSSIGAHLDKGNGLLAFYYTVENSLNSLPADTAITFMRPVSFYYNLLGFINTIKTQGVIATNYGGDVPKPWVSPIDIASAVAEELVEGKPASRKVRYVASDEINCDELAHLLGAAIGKPDLKWVVIPDEQLLKGMIAAGMSPKIAEGMVEMNAAGNSGLLYEDYYRNKPVLGKVKLTDFAKEFASVFQSN
jgi:uncharacterized protein YbjT (DUF2867 family)